MVMQMQPLPSFQSFLASARLSPSSSSSSSIVATQKQDLPMGYELDAERNAYPYDPSPAARMYQLASLTAREYEHAMRSPNGSSVGVSSPTTSDMSSDEDSRRRAAPSSTSSSTRGRTSGAKCHKKKYLKEKQRCEIVRRVRGGEKQAHLAKEFGVSRAAVCYLLKHQTEILSRCGDGVFGTTSDTPTARTV